MNYLAASSGELTRKRLMCSSLHSRQIGGIFNAATNLHKFYRRGEKVMVNIGNISKSMFVLTLALFLFPTFTSAQSTEDYPNRPIQLIVSWPAGASDDARARALATKLQEVLRQPMVVVNKPGAAGTLGLTLAAKSKPDGYILGHSNASSLVFAPHIQKVEYNSLTDFTYIAGTTVQPCAIVVRSDAPWKNLKELTNYAKNNPGKIKYGSWGIGGYAHVYMEMLGKVAGIDWVHIPFKGDQPNITALLGGHIPVSFLSSAFVPHAKAGKLRPLVMFTEKRMPNFPEIPTLNELGFNLDLRVSGSIGLVAPKGLSPEILMKLEKATKYAVESAEYTQAMEKLDSEAFYRDSQEYSRLIHQLYPVIGKMIKQLNLSQPGN
jgi:tripartite-type tricarboxylate transporter receptor subunit TctC